MHHTESVSLVNRDLSALLCDDDAPRSGLVIARHLAAQGVAVFPADRQTKAPLTRHGFKDASTDADQIRRWWSRYPDALCAYRTGAASGIAVLDLDLKDGRDGIEEARKRGLDPLTASPVSYRTRSGGLHVLFAHRDGLRSSADPATGIDVRADCGYAVAWGTFALPAEGLPAWPDGFGRTESRPQRRSVTDVTALLDAAPPFDVAGAREMLGYIDPACGRDDWVRIGMALHAASRGSDDGFALWRDWSQSADPARCTIADDRELLRQWESFRPGGGVGPGTLIGMAREGGWSIARPEDFDDLPAVPAVADRVYQPLRNDRGGLKLALVNVTGELVRLNRERGLGLAWDEMSGEGVWRDGRVDDGATASIRMLLEREAFRGPVGAELVEKAVDYVARQNPFHPIRDMLSTLKWDGVPRLDRLFVDYLGSEDNEYHRAVGRAFLIGMVARVMQPGCKHDGTLLLIGPQGAGKSTAARVLAGGDRWFSDSLPRVQGDAIEAARHIRGKWVVEIGEMAALKRADVEDMKRFLTVTIDRVRLPYARRDAEFPRQCVFVATTNDYEPLRDTSGNRRFWPVEVGTIGLEALERDRVQLFAEAMAAYRNGEKWHLSPEIEALARGRQEAAREVDVWEDAIGRWLDGDGGDGFGAGSRRDRVRVSEVLWGALNVPLNRQTIVEQRRAARCLQALGWRRGHTMKGKVWVR